MSKSGIKRGIAAAVCLLFAVSCTYVGTFKSGVSHADTVTSHARQFYIVGTKIIDPNGNVFIPIGANVGMSPNNFDWAGSAVGQSAAAQAWGWNTVRLTLDCTSAESYSRVNAKDGDRVLLSEIGRVVSEYTAKKIVVMIECHDAKKNANDAANFWTDVANKYKANPYVWFNYMNEPEWSDNDAWISEQKQWLQIVRSTGAENIFVADAMNTGNDAGWSGAKKIYDPSMGPALASGQCNVLMSMHNYGGLANSQDYLMRPEPFQAYWQNVQNAGLAMIIGEYGMDYRLAFQTQPNGSVKVVAANGTTAVNSIDNDQYHHAANGVYSTQYLAGNYGIGSLAWHATFADNLILGSPATGGPSGKPNFYNLLNASKTGVASGYSFSQMGATLWSNGHHKPAQTAFTGDYSQSHCGSVTSVSAPISLPPLPVSLRPVGSTASNNSTDLIAAQASRFGVATRKADPVLQNSFTVVVKPSAVTTANAPAGASTSSQPAPAATPITSTPQTTAKAKLQPTTDDTDQAAKRPATLFSLAGKPINSQQVSYFGGGSFTVLLLAIVAYHCFTVIRGRRLYAQHHTVTRVQPTAAPSMPSLSSVNRVYHAPGDVVRPNQSPRD